MKKITIQKEAIIKANGVRESGNCKPVLCIETGEVFASGADAAEKIGVHFSAISAICLGKTKTCKGKHYCYLSSALENLDAVMTRLREVAALEEDAHKWRKQEAEKEAVRKAEEQRQKDIEKAREKIAKYTENCASLEAKLTDNERCLIEAQNELNNLLGNVA